MALHPHLIAEVAIAIAHSMGAGIREAVLPEKAMAVRKTGRRGSIGQQGRRSRLGRTGAPAGDERAGALDQRPLAGARRPDRTRQPYPWRARRRQPARPDACASIRRCRSARRDRRQPGLRRACRPGICQRIRQRPASVSTSVAMPTKRPPLSTWHIPQTHDSGSMVGPAIHRWYRKYRPATDPTALSHLDGPRGSGAAHGSCRRIAI